MKKFSIFSAILLISTISLISCGIYKSGFETGFEVGKYMVIGIIVLILVIVLWLIFRKK